MRVGRSNRSSRSVRTGRRRGSARARRSASPSPTTGGDDDGPPNTPNNEERGSGTFPIVRTDGAEQGERTLGERFPRLIVENVRPDLLIDLLEPYAAFCAAREFSLDRAAAVSDRSEFIERAYRLLNARDAERPRRLDAATEAITQLAADDESEDHLRVSLSRDRRKPSIPLNLNRAELAVFAHERYPHAFERAGQRRRGPANARVREYLPCKPGCLAIQGSSARDLLERLAGRNGALGLADFADVRIVELDDEVRIFWLRGAPDHGPTRQIEACDLTFIDRATGLLTVGADDADQTDFLRAAVGEVFFADAGHYAHTAIYTGQPLLRAGRRALAIDGVAGLRSVQLRAVTIEFRSSVSTSIFATEGCLFDGHASLLAQAARTPGAVVRAMTLAIEHSDTSVRLAEIAMPNQLDFDRRIAAVPFRAFLAARGFVDSTERPRRRVA